MGLSASTEGSASTQESIDTEGSASTKESVDTKGFIDTEHPISCESDLKLIDECDDFIRIEKDKELKELTDEFCVIYANESNDDKTIQDEYIRLQKTFIKKNRKIWSSGSKKCHIRYKLLINKYMSIYNSLFPQDYIFYAVTIYDNVSKKMENIVVFLFKHDAEMFVKKHPLLNLKNGTRVKTFLKSIKKQDISATSLCRIIVDNNVFL